MARDKLNPRQIDADRGQFSISRQSFIHPSSYRPTVADIQRWRLVASEPVNKMARRLIQREVASLNFVINPKDPNDQNQLNAVAWYTDIFRDYRNLMSRTLKAVCELPQGGAWEIGRLGTDYFKEGKGTLFFVKFIDAGTLHPTANNRFPIAQVDPMNSLRRVNFREGEIHRILAFPRDEFDMQWWQESPTEASYMAIEALSRIYVYYLKQLQDTPVAGILDLMDFSSDDAKEWAKSFKEMLTGIDPVKIPLLYEHEQPAKWLPMGRNPDELSIPEQFKRFAELVLGNYGLSTSDLRMFSDGGTKAGAAISRKISTTSGVGFFAELVKDAVQALLPDFLTFTYSNVDIEQERTKAQIRAADARTIQTFDWMPIRFRVEQAKKWGVIDIDVNAEEVEKEASEILGPEVAMGGTAPKPGQLETGEGKRRDVLEDDAKENAAGGTRIFAKSVSDLVEGAVSRFKANFEQSRYGQKKEQAAIDLEALVAAEFRQLGQGVTVDVVGDLVDKVYTQFPDVKTDIDDGPVEAKSHSWNGMVDRLSEGDYGVYLREKTDDLRGRIEALLEILLADAEFAEMSDEDFLEALVEIYAAVYEDGLLGSAELIQTSLYKEGQVKSPNVKQSFNLVDPEVINFLEERALETVEFINSGTKFYLKRLIVEGVMDGMSVFQITDNIHRDLFGLPEGEAGKLNLFRIRSIVTTEINRADTYGRLKQLEMVGLTLKRWITRLIDVCPVCVRNESKGSVPLDFEYEDVFGTTLGPPGHPITCHCALGADAEELENLGTAPEYWTGGSASSKKGNGKKKSYFKSILEKHNPYHDELGRFTTSQRAISITGKFLPTGQTRRRVDVARAIDQDKGTIGRLGTEQYNINNTYTFTTEDGEELFVKEYDEFDPFVVYEEEPQKEVLARQAAEVLGAEDHLLEVWNVNSENGERLRVANPYIGGEVFADTSLIERERLLNDMSNKQFTEVLGYEMIVNNTDRHGANVMISDDGQLVLIDNARTFGFDSPARIGRANTVVQQMYKSDDRVLDASVLRRMSNSRNEMNSLIQNSGVTKVDTRKLNIRYDFMDRMAGLAEREGGLTLGQFQSEADAFAVPFFVDVS